MTSKERLIIFILLLINFTHIVDFMIMMPLGPIFMKLFQISPAQFGFAVSAYGLMAGITSLLSAFFVDRFDRKHILLVAYTGFLIGTFACAFASSYPQLVAARLLAGFFGGLITAQVLSIISDLVPYERRASAMGLLSLGFSAASVVGVPGGLWLATRFNWQTAFLAVGFLGLFILAAIFIGIPNVNAHIATAKENRVSPLQTMKGFWEHPNRRLALFCSFILMLGHFSIIPFITPSLVLNIGFPQAQVPYIYLFGGALTIITGPLVGKLADKRGKLNIFLFFAGLSTIAIWLITNMQPYPIFWVFFILCFFFICTNSRLIPFQAMISEVTPPQQRGSFMSINSSLQQLSTALAANIGGWLIVEGPNGRLEHYDRIGWFSIFFVLLSAFFVSKLKQKEKQSVLETVAVD